MNQARVTPSTQSGVYRIPGPDTGTDLVCFAHAGAFPTTYRPWATELGGRFRVWVGDVEHGDFAGTDESLWGRYAEQQAEALVNAVQGPITLYGHSMGALSAYETTRELRRRGHAVTHLIVSGCDAPQTHTSVDLPRDPAELTRVMADRYGGIPDEFLAEPELMRMFGSELRADFDALAEYTWNPGPPLDVPLTVVGGSVDPVVSDTGLRAWSQHTTGPFRLERLPGGHFFTDAERLALFALLG